MGCPSRALGTPFRAGVAARGHSRAGAVADGGSAALSGVGCPRGRIDRVGLDRRVSEPIVEPAARRWWLAISGTVACRCERCLEPVNLSVRERRGFEFFDSAGEADRATEQQAHDAADSDGSGPSPEFEQLDFLSVDDGLSLKDLVEDEILLALPMAPKHANCRAPAPLGGDARLSDGSVSPGPLADEAPATTRPFAGLRDLLKKP